VDCNLSALAGSRCREATRVSAVVPISGAGLGGTLFISANSSKNQQRGEEQWNEGGPDDAGQRLAP